MRLPGTRLLFEGFYKVRFQLNDTVGRSVMYARDGKMLGGNSAFAHIGTYEKIGDEIAIEIKTVRHNPDPNYRAMAGTDDEGNAVTRVPCQVVARVRVPPTVVFDYLRTINENLSTYEANFGSIQRPDSCEVYPPDE